MADIIAPASHFNILDGAGQAAVDTVSNQVSVLSQQVSVLSQAVSVISAGIGLMQMKVVTNVQGISAVSSKISGLSVSVLAGAVYQIEANILYSTSGTANVYKFGMSVSAVTLGAIAGMWTTMVQVGNNAFTSATMVNGTFNTINGAQVSALPGTTGIVCKSKLDAILVAVAGGTLRLESGVSAAAAPINIMKGSFVRAHQIA